MNTEVSQFESDCCCEVVRSVFGSASYHDKFIFCSPKYEFMLKSMKGMEHICNVARISHNSTFHVIENCINLYIKGVPQVLQRAIHLKSCKLEDYHCTRAYIYHRYFLCVYNIPVNGLKCCPIVWLKM